VNMLNERLIEQCESSCKAELDRIIHGYSELESNSLLHFDTGLLSNLLALYILTPFLISVTANFASVKLNSRWIREQPARNLRRAIQERIGSEVRIGDPAMKEECVIIVEELLKPYGVSREDARRIIDLLTTTVAEPPQYPGRDA
jgi:hypothetical protein